MPFAGGLGENKNQSGLWRGGTNSRELRERGAEAEINPSVPPQTSPTADSINPRVWLDLHGIFSQLDEGE